MKYIYIFTTLMMLCAQMNSFGQKVFKIVFSQSDFNIEKVDGMIRIDTELQDRMAVGNEHTPHLPYFSYRVLLPSGTNSTKYKAEYVSEPIMENVDIESIPQSFPTNQIIEYKRSSASESVLTPVLYDKVNELYDYRYALFSVTPFIYDAKNKQLSFVSEIRITIPELDDLSTDESTEPDDYRYREIKELVINKEDILRLYPEQMMRATATSGEQIDYLIITADSLVDSFDKLARWKIKKGIRTKVVGLSEVYEDYLSIDSEPLRIKSYIYDLYTNNNVRFVLLGGDAQIVPAQMCEVRLIGTIKSESPSDLFYACFNGTFDWDSNNNGILAESSDNINLTPQVYLTRIPVRSHNEISNYVNKVVNYETLPLMNNYVKKILMAGVGESSVECVSKSIAHCQGDAQYNSSISPYWNGNRDYFYDTGNSFSGGSSYELNVDNFKAQLNSNYHIVDMFCHGNRCVWELENGYFFNKDAKSLTNNGYSIIVTNACHTNAFDDPDDCLSSAFLRNENGGGIAYFGSSRYGCLSNYYNYNPSLQYNAYFYRKLFNGASTLEYPYSFGVVATEAKRHYVDLLNVIEERFLYLMLTINPMGDPEMPIYTENPSQFSGATVTRSGNNLTVSTGGVSGCTIAVTSADKGETYFTVAKNVSSRTFTNVPKFCHVVITKHNYKPYTALNTDISGLYISGDSIISSMSTYYIPNLPAGATVTWTCNNPGANVQSDVPEENQCQVSKHSSSDFFYHATLYAVIKVEDTVITTLTKYISTNFIVSGHYQQDACVFNGVSNASIPSTSLQTTAMFVHQGCIVRVYSSDFSGKTITYSGATPSYWYFDGNNTINFSLPYSASGYPFYINVPSSAPSISGRLIFVALPGGSFSSSNALWISASGNNAYKLSLFRLDDTYTEESDQKREYAQSDTWSLDVFSLANGQRMVSEKIAGVLEYTLDTTGWKPGIYIVRVEINGEILTEKITVR